MLTTFSWLALLHIAIVTSITLRVALRDDISADARMAWFMTVILFPIVGYVLYFMFGSARMAHAARLRHQHVSEAVRHYYQHHTNGDYLGKSENLANIPSTYQAPFRYLHSLNQLYPVSGNSGELMADGESARARLLADIEAAQTSVNVLYYIWLDDHTGQSVARALIRAKQRGVDCRVMVDALGSRTFLHSQTWRDMQAAGIKMGVTLPLKPWWVIFMRRIDLRNHRKITIIDGKIAYCGSQNCADEAFTIKAKYAPWVDIMVRFKGPIVTQTQMLYDKDWKLTTGESPTEKQTTYAEHHETGFPAQIMGEGPTDRQRSTAQLLVSLITSATKTLTISTPYFVPDPTVLEALCTVAWRGVQVTLIFPERNDSWIVAAVSRSHYRRLLKAGCHIYEYRDGLLHAKTLTIDGQIAFIGSTNLDLRSFDLNYENNVLFYDSTLTNAIYQRQQAYMAQAKNVTLATVDNWPWWQHIWHNVLASVGPIL